MTFQIKKSFINTIKIGYIPLCDAAPIIIADKLGYFSKYNLNVELKRQIGWATIRDRLLNGDLDASHALAPMLFENNDATHSRGRLITGLILNCNGNAITISKELYKTCLQKNETLKQYKEQTGRKKRLVFATVYPFSYHQILLNKWLYSNGIDPSKDVEIVVIPPALMGSSLASGVIDGFCVGEPWNSASQLDGSGHIVETSESLDDNHPEKVLLTTEQFAVKNSEQHAALIQAIMEACEFCNQSDNRKEIVKILSAEEYLNVSKKALTNSFCNKLKFGDEFQLEELHKFYGNHLNQPTLAKAIKLKEELVNAKLITKDQYSDEELKQIFRTDIFDAALTTTS
jgi:ABC-type nitrate/sulfonate/bicarbonate transport system substrate-binding protein